jgi:hypothetical protein
MTQFSPGADKPVELLGVAAADRWRLGAIHQHGYIPHGFLVLSMMIFRELLKPPGRRYTSVSLGVAFADQRGS